MSDAPEKKPAACPRCGRALGEDGMCVHCLGRMAFGDELTMPKDFPASLGTIRYFGDYELIDEIARGGMGVVYRAMQVSLGREVAIKLMLNGALSSSEDVERFRAEARAAAGLKHPGIIAIHEVGEFEGQHYFSMDLIAGQNLEQLTRSGPLEARRAAELIVQVATAVEYAHRMGVLHRDIKPSNVLVDAEGRAHVADFGLARRIHVNATVTQPGQIMGTPGFMAPEQAAGAARDVGVPADVYSLGALLYHLLTARPPFLGANIPDVLRQVAESDPVSLRLLNPAVSRDLETIALKCLAKDRARRYGSAAELAEDLGRYLRHEPIRARPVSKVGRLWRWSQRNRAVASLIAAVALLLVAVAIGSTISAARLSRARRQQEVLRKESEERLRQGEKLIEFMLGDLSDRLEPVGRLDVLDTTLDAVGKFYSEVPTDRMTPESQRNRARSMMQVANVRSSQGKNQEAFAAFDQSIAAYRALIAAHPENLEWQFELTRVINDRGVTFLMLQNFKQGAETLEECLKLRQDLVQKEAKNGFWLWSLGGTAQNLSNAYRHLGNMARSGELLRIAEDAQRKWVIAEPNSSKAKERLAIVMGTLGSYYASNNQPAESRKAYGEKLDILEKLLVAEPKNRTFQLDLALALGQVADMNNVEGHYEAGLAQAERSVAILDNLVAEDPENRDWQTVRINSLYAVGTSLGGSAKVAEALVVYERIWELTAERLELVKTLPKWANDFRLSAGNACELVKGLADEQKKLGNEQEAARWTRQAEIWQKRMDQIPAP